jgi:hypothetical protein
MGKMVHATIHETEHQVTIQTVFRKPENLSQPSYHITERSDYYPMNSERSSTYSSTFNSDGNYFLIIFSIESIFCFIDEYVREKPQRTKAKKRPKKRPQSATISENDSVRLDILL